MDLNIWALAGFLLASYSVIANDSIQTLGTFIASNKESINWKILWLFGATIFSMLFYKYIIFSRKLLNTNNI